MSLTYLAIFIFAIILLNVISKLIPKPAAISPQSDKCTVADHALRNYFSNPLLLDRKHVNSFIEDIGPYQDSGSFDFGVSVYIWRTETIRIEVWMENDYLRDLEIKIEEISHR